MSDENACTHPKIASWKDILDPLSGSECYKCMQCGKEIAIPVRKFYLELEKVHTYREILAAIRERCAGIIGLAFGDQWREKMLNGDYERRWNK